jgi:hypothetical protein
LNKNHNAATPALKNPGARATPATGLQRARAMAAAETVMTTATPSSHHRPVLRVLWPRHLCEELRSVDHQALLYGYFIAPAKPSLSPYCTAVVIGAVAAPPSSSPARRAQAARALARPNVPPKHDQWRIQLRALGTWHASREDALLAAAEAGGDHDHPNDGDDDCSTSGVLDPPLLLLHAWGGRTYSPAASNFAARVHLPEIAAWRMPRGRRGGVNDCNGGDHHHAPSPPPDLQLFGYTLPREGYGHIFLSSNALGGGVGGSAVASAPWLVPRPAAAAVAAAAAGRDKQKQGAAEQPPPQPPATWCFVMGDLVAPWPWLQPVQGASALEMAVACANRAEAAARSVAIALAAECDDGGGEGLKGGATANPDDAPAGLRRRRRQAPTEATSEPAAAAAAAPSSSSSCGWWGTDRAALERRLWFRLCSGGGEGCLARCPLEGTVLAPPEAAVAVLLPWRWPWRRRRRASDAATEGAGAAVVLPPPPPAEPLPPLAAFAALLSWAATLAIHASSTKRYAARKLRGYQHGDAAAAAATVLPSPPRHRRRRPPFALTAAQRWDAAALNAARLHTERDVTAELAQHAVGLVLGLWLACRAPVVGAALASLCARLCAVAPLVSASAAGGGAHGAGPLAAVVAWLASAAPGGVKLHAELALLLGAALRALLSAAASLYGSELGAALLTCTAYAVALASASFGLSAGLAAAADAVGLVAWPVGLAYAALAALYSLQRRAIAVTWGLMRGAGTADVVAAAQAVAARRRRRQRQRREREREHQQRRDAGLGPLPPLPSIDNATPSTTTTTPTPAEAAAVLWARSQGGKDGVRGGGGDGNGSNGAAPATNADIPSSAAAAAPAAASSDEVAAEHLIVGVLLFTPLIALLPTMAAFYAAAAVAHGATALLRLALLGLARQLVVNPLAYAAARRALTPRLFPGDLSVAPLRPVDESGRGAAAAAAAQQQQQHDCPPSPPPPRCYLLGNRPLHYSQLLHCAALLSRFDGGHAFARVLRAFAAGRPFGFVL